MGVCELLKISNIALCWGIEYRGVSEIVVEFRGLASQGRAWVVGYDVIVCSEAVHGDKVV